MPPNERSQPPAELQKTPVAGIADLPTLLEISYDEYDAADESHDLSDLGSAEGKPPISLKHPEFSLMQFAKRMEQANYSTFNKWKKVWVAKFLEKKQRSIIRGQNQFKHVRDRPLHWVTAVTDFLRTFEKWLLSVNSDNAEWIPRRWVEMCLKKCASEIREARKEVRRGNKRPDLDL